jgi:tetratricopeptide (TPR) repeat protein
MMKLFQLLLLLALLFPAGLQARDEVNPADLAAKASTIFQEAEGLCAKGEYKSALKKYEEAITAYNEAVRAYRKAKDDKSVQNLKEKVASVKEARDACKKKMKEAEAAEKERKRQQDSEGSGSADGH